MDFTKARRGTKLQKGVAHKLQEQENQSFFIVKISEPEMS
jgi:hypothetical protein